MTDTARKLAAIAALYVAGYSARSRYSTVTDFARLRG